MTMASKKSRRSRAVLAIAVPATAVLVAVGIAVGCNATPGPVEKTATSRQALASSNGFSQNGLTTNGLVSNGAWFNGAWFNGAWFNGAWFNGAWFNGAWFNGAWFNGAWFNGAWFNGAWFNGLFSNNLWATGVDPNGGPPAAGSPAAALQSSPYLRQLLPYVYGCAMPGALDPITNTPIDPTTYDTTLDPNNGTLKCAPPGAGGEEAGADGGPACDVGYTCSSQGTCVIALHGQVGLAINADGSAWWGETAAGTIASPGAVGDGGVGDGGVGGGPGTCDESCQRWVSACVLARTNAYGAHVEISMRAPANAPQAIKNALATSPPEVASFALREGAYYGNIFESAPTPLVCSGPSNSCAAAGPPSATCYTQCVSAGPPPTPDGGPYSGPATGPVAETPTFYACAGPASNIPELTKRFCSSQGDQVVINVPGVCLTTPTEQGTCAAEDTNEGSSTLGAIQHCYTTTAARSANACAGPDDPTCYDQVITVYLKDPIAVCGNGVCETNTEPDGGAGGENSTNCPSDCPPGAWAKDFDPSFESFEDQNPPFSSSLPQFSQLSMTAVAPDDTIVVVGDTVSDVNLGGVTLKATGGAGVLVKYNADGSYAWPSRGIRFGNTLSSNTVLGVTGLTVAAGGTSQGTIAVIGLSNDGGTLWMSTFSAAGVQNGTSTWPVGSSPSFQAVSPTRALTVDSKGNFLLAGVYSGTAIFPTVPPTSLTSTGSTDTFLAEISPQGSMVWAQDPNVMESPGSLVVDSHDNIVLAAYQCGASCTTLVKLCAGGTCGQCANGSAAQCAASGGQCADNSTPRCTDGSTAWTKNFAGRGQFTVANVDPTDTSGSVYAAGTFGTGFDFGGGARTVVGSPPFIVKYDSNGNYKWDSHGTVVCPPSPLNCGSGEVWATNLSFDSAHNVVLASSGDPSVGGGIDFGVGTFPTYHSTNIFLVAYEPNGGSPQWAKQIPAILGVDARGIDLDSKDRVLVSGVYGGSMQVDDSLLITAVPEDPNTVDPFLASFGGPSPLDTTPPIIGAGIDQTGASINTVPNTIIAQATSQCGALVFFMPPTAIDNGDPDAGAPPPGTSVACSPPPNTTFPIGSTLVKCTASDPFGHAQNATFTVTVADTLAPAFLPFANINVQAPTGASSVTVSYAPTAADQVDCSTPASPASGTACTSTSNPCTPVTCTPPSGSTFAVGTTPVTCTATDKANNTSQMTFSVNVTAALGFGGTCSTTGQCASGSCVDGVCCNTTATSCGQCQACNVPGSAGTCAPTTGGSCNDGNDCTQTDTCQAGVCTGSNPVTCAASDACHTAGTCNPSTGACSNPAAANGTNCSDGNACTQTDTCQAGVCTGSNPVTCAASDACHTAGTCNPSTGACSNPAAANGTICNDGNACTQTDTCQAGVCTGSNPVTCSAGDQCHTAGTCNPSTGACSNPAAANGTTCNDGNACTQTDTCQAGSCTGSNPVTCSASDQCHTAGTCSPSTGTCSNPAVANGTSCNDGNACTQSDTCQAGVCTGTKPVTCAASDSCHVAGTCDPSTGVCSNPAAPSGTAGCGVAPGIGSFAVYATEAIELSSGSSITGCNVGVENTGGPFLGGGAAAYLSSGAKIQSSQTLYASSVYLSSGASLGPIDTNHVVRSSGATYGTLSTFPAMPVLPAAPSATAGITAVTLGAGSSRTLVSGAYGSVTVNSGATLKLTGGTYVFASLTLNSGATLAVSAATVLSVTGAASFSSGSSLGPASGSGLTAKALAVYFDGSSGINVSSGAKVRALFVAPKALVTVSTSSFTGAIAAAQVLMNAGATLTCQDGLGSLSTSNPISVTVSPDVACGGGVEGDSIPIVISDSSDTLSVNAPDPTDGSATYTLPTALPTGATYDVTVTTTSSVYTCTFDSSGSSGASGVVEGPVSLTVTCVRNNC